MTPQELKNSILQLAIQGKLVEQRPEEGTSQKLYAQIQAEKQCLIKEGKLKKEKPLPEITEDEKPFEIPEGWMWVRLNDIVTKSIKRGKSPTYTSRSAILVFAQKCNTKAGYIDLSLAQYLDESKLNKYPPEEFMKDHDIIINSTGNGTLGRVGIYCDSDNPKGLQVVPDSHVTIIRTNNLLSYGFVFYVLKYYQPYMEKLGSGSTNQTELSAGVIKELLFPLPPLDEQKRIVAKIEELLPLVDRYEQAWTKLEDFNRRFPEDMKKSILQQAIQGKLVEQRPEEGTAQKLYAQIQAEKQRLIKAGKLKKEKPLPEITEDEKPFEIPEGWMWVRVGDIFRTSSGTTPSRSKSEYYDNGLYNWVRTTDLNNSILTNCEIKISELAFKECRLDILPRESVCIAMYGGAGTIGKNAMIMFDTTINQSVCAVHPNPLCNMKYFQYYIQFYRPYWMDYAAGSRKDPNINQVIIKNTLFPLPPLFEQNRIVARLEKLLPLCERLK